jgi:hypothetical protein
MPSKVTVIFTIATNLRAGLDAASRRPLVSDPEATAYWPDSVATYRLCAKPSLIASATGIPPTIAPGIRADSRPGTCRRAVTTPTPNRPI